MPTTSTPIRSAQSPISSPVTRKSKSPIGLTSQSKVKALPVYFSDDSDSSNNAKTPTDPSSITKNNASNQARPSPPSHRNGPFAESSDSEEEDELVSRKPRGKIASRMAAQQPDESDGDGEEGAYERVKKMLIAGGKTSTPHRINEQTAEQNCGDQEDELAAAQENSPTRRAPSATPGLFVSPEQPRASSRLSDPVVQASGSDDELPSTLFGGSRLQELVAKKRAERLAKEQVEKEKAKDKHRLKKAATKKGSTKRPDSTISARHETNDSFINDDYSDADSDIESEVGARLTQQARPTRKASKKALEEMNRETQRMSRNQQLAHQAKTKKRFSTKDLFKAFNYRQDLQDPADSAADSIPNSAHASSDVEMTRGNDTPPTSPPTFDDSTQKRLSTDVITATPVVTQPGQEDHDSVDEDLPDIQEILSQAPGKLDKGKGRAVDFEPKTYASKPQQTPVANKKRSVRMQLPARSTTNTDSDDDLEIVQSRFPVFDTLPNKKSTESHSLLTLRALAHLTSPSNTRKKDSRLSITSTEMLTNLQRRARQQALGARNEKIEELKAKGIYVPTAEEQEKDLLHIENALEKARMEALEMAKQEKAERKKNGETDGLSSDESEDEEWVEEGENGDDENEKDEEMEVELSGSEDEDEDADIEDEEEAEKEESGFFDDAAKETDEESDAHEEAFHEREDAADADASDADENSIPAARHHTSRKRAVIDDEEDEDELPTIHSRNPVVETPKQPQSSLAAAFGFGPKTSPNLGLTQAFAGTMADLESQGDQNDSNGSPTQEATQEQDSLDFLRELPKATAPDFIAPMMDDSQDLLVQDSQADARDVESQPFSLGLSQFPSVANETPRTQASEFPDPTQDVGFGGVEFTPVGNIPHSTTDTVLLPIAESPIVRRKGRLQRGRQETVEFSDADDEDVSMLVEEEDDFDTPANAFDALRKAAKAMETKPATNAFDKKKSEARAMFEEQAEESDDEWAGAGGGDDEEVGEANEEDLKMIDDDRNVKVDENKIAAFYQDKMRAADEKAVNKLYQDITTGALKRRRGGELDLSDSDDDMEQRRRKKQREFARMRKALLEDENIGQIAENPKKQAFFHALEDRDDEDVEFLDAPEELPDSIPDSQEDQSAGNRATAPGKPTLRSIHPLKTKHHLSSNENDENRPPSSYRHQPKSNQFSSKPVNITEIRETVSFLIDDPNASTIHETQYSDSEPDDEPQPADTSSRTSMPPPERPSYSARRTAATGSKKAVIDRLSLAARRASSLSNASGDGSHMAFEASSATSLPGMRMPSLLRRSSSGATGPMTSVVREQSMKSTSMSAAAVAADSGVRRGGSKKSSIHYQAREAERRAVLERVEKNVEVKTAGEGKKGGLLGMLGKGGWE